MNRLALVGTFVALLTSAASQAQNVGGVGDFTVERILTLSSIIAPTAPNLPDQVRAGMQNGTLEIHQRFTYNSAQRTLDQLAFVLPANSPLPFPNASAAPVADHYIIHVESASSSSSPAGSVILSGHAVSNDVPTPWGDITGAGVTLTFAFRSAGSSVQFGPVLESVSPLYGLYSPTGAGSLSLSPSPQTCGTATLNGAYIFTLSGSLRSGNGFAPFAESGRFVADGNGNVTVHDSGNAAGAVFQGRTFPMTYTVDNNCQGTFTWPGASMDFQVSRNGKQVTMTFTGPTSIMVNGSAQLQ